MADASLTCGFNTCSSTLAVSIGSHDRPFVPDEPIVILRTSDETDQNSALAEGPRTTNFSICDQASASNTSSQTHRPKDTPWAIGTEVEEETKLGKAPQNKGRFFLVFFLALAATGAHEAQGPRTGVFASTTSMPDTLIKQRSQDCPSVRPEVPLIWRISSKCVGEALDSSTVRTRSASGDCRH